MKKAIVLIAAILFFNGIYCQPVKLFPGVTGGVGDMMAHDQLDNLQTSEGTSDFLNIINP